jgi:hypothetical protein
MLRGGNPDTWHGWIHGTAFLLIIATSVLAPLTMALAVRGDRSWRPIGVVSLAANALFVVFLISPFRQRLISDGNRHSLRLDRSTGRTPHHASLVNDLCSP